MKKRTRVQAMLLVLCMMLSFCGFSASAESVEADTTITVAAIDTPSEGDSGGASAGGGEAVGDGGGSAGGGGGAASGESAGNGNATGSGSANDGSTDNGSVSGGSSALDGSAGKSAAEAASAGSQNTAGSTTDTGSNTDTGNVTDSDTASGASSPGEPIKESSANQSTEEIPASSDKAADENGQTGSISPSVVPSEGDSDKSETSLSPHAENETPDTASNQSAATDPDQAKEKATQSAVKSADGSENTRSAGDNSGTDDKDQDDTDEPNSDGNIENKTISNGDDENIAQTEMEIEGGEQQKSDEDGPEQSDEENPEGESPESGVMKKTALSMNNALSENAPEGESDENEKPEDNAEEKKDESAAEKNDTTDKNSGVIDVFIEGTLKSDGVPILISEEVDPDNVTITVWKIESPVKLEGESEEHVVYEETTDGIKSTDNSNEVESNINYIIKIEPSQETFFNLLSGSNTIERNGRTYDIATQGKTITLQINVPSGYHLKKAYGDDGKEVELKKDANGAYFVEVPMGGGVYLNAELEKTDNGGSSSSGGDSSSSDSGYYDYSWSGVAVSVVTPAAVKPSVQEDNCSFTLDCDGIYVVFKLNGGSLAGTDGPIIIPAEAGELFALLQAPLRPGFRFVRWEPCCPKITATMPGQTFTVKKTVVFVAIWEALDGKRVGAGNEEYQTGPATDNDDDDDEDDDGPDVTETVRITEDNNEELNVNSITVTETSEKAIGVDITASQDVDVDEGIKVTGGESGAIGIRAKASGQTISMEVETGDGMSVTSSGPSVGIQASASGGHSLAVEFEGNVEASSSGSGESAGIQVSAEPGSSASVTVEGDVTSSDGPGLVLGGS